MRVTTFCYNSFTTKQKTKGAVTLMSIVTLLNTLVEELNSAEENFYSNPKDFYSLETSVKTSTESFAASFLGLLLSEINSKIENDGWRNGKYTVQRHDSKTLITSVGDVVFDNTYFRSKKDGSYHYLTEEVIGLSKNEQFSEAAETAILVEALKTSYAEAAKVIPSKSEITKTTVMNKVHGIAEQIVLGESVDKKQCENLIIEADEDHVAEQHGRWNDKSLNKSFLCKLIYLYEYKRDVPGVKGRKELVNTFYVGGVYEGTDGNEKLWNTVKKYIENHYDFDCIKHIYINGDGAQWIKSGTRYIEKSLFITDKFHLMKYINAAANQMLDKADIAKSEIYRMLYKREKEAFIEYTNSMISCAKNPEPVEQLQTFVVGNWAAVMRTYHNKTITGCSAESHVSHVLSDRLSSRPMGWSTIGADRMTKLRCYERNFGREGIINLVQYSRLQRKLKRTGTDDVEKEVSFRHLSHEHYDQARSYIDRLQVSVPQEIRKIASIREQIKLI